MAGRQNDSRWLVQIGADRSAAVVLERARARGIDTLVFDPESDAPGARIATRLMTRETDDLDGIHADIQAVSQNGRVLGIATNLRSANALRATAKLREDFGVPGPSSEGIETFLTRSAWKKVLTDAEIATPVSAILESPIELDRFLGAYPSALLKPATGGRGSAGVSRVRIGDPRNREIFDEARLVSDSELVRVEAFVAGDEYSVNGVIRGGVFKMLSLGRRFSMRNLRGTLPTGMAWGCSQAGSQAGDDPRWNAFGELAACVACMVGVNESFLSLDILDDGEALHVIDVRPQLGLAVDRGLAFSGVDIAAMALDFAIGANTVPEVDAGRNRLGYALRFLYPAAQGCLELNPEDPPGSAEEKNTTETTGWRSVPLSEGRAQIDWEKEDGQAVERPRSTADRIACVFVESEDRNAAWMRANEIDPDSLFRVLESTTEVTTAQPIWPMRPTVT